MAYASLEAGASATFSISLRHAAAFSRVAPGNQLMPATKDALKPFLIGSGSAPSSAISKGMNTVTAPNSFAAGASFWAFLLATTATAPSSECGRATKHVTCPGGTYKESPVTK